jgi:P2-related tail formation protein
MRRSGEILFADARLRDGLPDALWQEPWVQTLESVFAAEIARLLEKTETSIILAGIDKLPEFLLDALAEDMLLWNYRDTDSMERKRENIKKAWQFWSKAGTVEASRKIADVYFGHAATMEEWFQYGGLPNYFRVRVMDYSPPWSDILAVLDVADYFKRLSQEMEPIEIELADACETIFCGAAVVDDTAETIRALPQINNTFCGAAINDVSYEIIETTI